MSRHVRRFLVNAGAMLAVLLGLFGIAALVVAAHSVWGPAPVLVAIPLVAAIAFGLLAAWIESDLP